LPSLNRERERDKIEIHSFLLLLPPIVNVGVTSVVGHGQLGLEKGLGESRGSLLWNAGVQQLPTVEAAECLVNQVI
jgi:hypothetical protein